MFSVHILRSLRPCVVFQSFNCIHGTAVRYGAFPVSCCNFRGVSGKKLHAVTRSFLRGSNELVQSHCSSSRLLSTMTHSEDGNLIYTGSLGNAVRGVKMFSYSSSGASLVVMPYILLTTGLGLQSLVMQAAFCGVIGFFTFLTPVLLHLVTKGYVVRLYHNPDKDTYTAITYSVFLTEKRTVFHQRQVRIPAVSKMFTTFYANSMGLLVNPDLFSIPHDYNHLMGYDKPFSFDIDDVDRPDKS
ncbi:Transmembrane protein 70, mitochondrial Precursor [Channa argus]|uniref:Transmembrane protein 70, mitochondrial n=1 Tax=Channa argus TaxID=215402 RepID=A0A6G1Q8M8_CHAAH|nr:Transmembrane protein 70, mitochondrial Precursor [Channa argus]